MPVLIFLLAILLSTPLVVRAENSASIIASENKIKEVLQRLPKEFQLIRPYLEDSDHQWKLHSGDMLVDSAFNNNEALIVDGNLKIKGNYDDYQGGIGMLVVLGDMEVDNLISWGSIAVTGNLKSTGLVYGYYNDFTFEVGSLEAKAFVLYDKSSHLGSTKVNLSLSSDEFQGPELLKKVVTTFSAEVIAPEMRDYIGGELSQIFPDYDACQSRLAKGLPVFRDIPAANSLYQDLLEILQSEIAPARLKELSAKDKLLKMVAAMREDLPPDLQEEFYKTGDPELVALITEHPRLSPKLLEKLSQHSDPKVVAGLALRSDLPEEVVRSLSRSTNPDIRLSIIERGHARKLSAADLDRLLKDPDPRIKSEILKDRNVSLNAEQILSLAGEQDPAIRESVANYLSDEASWERYPILSSNQRAKMAAGFLSDAKLMPLVIPALSAEDQEKLFAESSSENKPKVLYSLARSTRSRQLQLEITKGAIQEIKEELAKNLALPRAIQLELIAQLTPAAKRPRISMFDSDGLTQAMNSPEGVVDKLMENPNTDAEAIMAAAKYCADTRGNATFCNALTSRDNLSEEVLAVLIDNYFGEAKEDLALTVLGEVASSRKQVEWAMPIWFDDQDEIVAEFKKLSKKADADFWSALANSEIKELRALAATNKNTPAPTLTKLMQDPESDVRTAASKNPSLDAAILESLPLGESLLWSVHNPKLSSKKLKEIYLWAKTQGEYSLVSDCLERLAARQSAAAETADSPWLTHNTSDRLKRVTQIDVAEISAMTRTPRIVLPGDPEFYQRLHPTKQARLLQILSEAKKIEPSSRLAECKYLPGYSLLLKTEDKEILSVLVCFNCDLFALGEWQRQIASAPVQSYGDLRPHRDELISLLR